MKAGSSYFIILTAWVTVSTASAQEKDFQEELLQPEQSACQLAAASLELPFEEIQLDNGSVLKFFADSAGSVSVSEQGVAGNKPVLSHQEFQEGTIADVYWAVTTDDRSLPEFLMTNHEKVAEEPFAALGAGRERGWWLHRAAAQEDLAKVDNCISGVQNFVCNTNPGSYPSGPGCFNNHTNTLAWYNNSDEVRRYRTGVCSHGTYDANIWGGYAGPPGCVYFQPAFLKHVGRFSNTYYLYWWSGASGHDPRSYRNSVSYVSGGSFDWGVRYKHHTSSSCSI